jgi:simple sugar transport system permease protein
LIGAIFIQTLTIMLQMRGVITEHTLIIKAIVALAVCYMQTPSFERLVRRVRPVEST